MAAAGKVIFLNSVAPLILVNNPPETSRCHPFSECRYIEIAVKERTVCPDRLEYLGQEALGY
jgi:hypothetical protein